MKKINKEFVLSDSSLNSYSFRLLTSGYQLSEFAKNPIGYYMHKRDDGVIVRWDDLQIRGDKVVGKPVINTNNARGIQTVLEVESGFLNAASVGHIVVLESSNDPALKLPGQENPTITKWYNKECSLVDIPGNSNALVLYDVNGDVIGLNNLKALANNFKFASQSNTSNSGKSVSELLSEALKEGIINSESFLLLKSKYQNDVSGLTEILTSLRQARTDYLKSLSWDYLDKNGLLEELMQRDFVAFEAKKKHAFPNYQS